MSATRPVTNRGSRPPCNLRRSVAVTITDWQKKKRRSACIDRATQGLTRPTEIVKKHADAGRFHTSSRRVDSCKGRAGLTRRTTSRAGRCPLLESGLTSKGHPQGGAECSRGNVSRMPVKRVRASHDAKHSSQYQGSARRARFILTQGRVGERASVESRAGSRAPWRHDLWHAHAGCVNVSQHSHRSADASSRQTRGRLLVQTDPTLIMLARTQRTTGDRCITTIIATSGALRDNKNTRRRTFEPAHSQRCAVEARPQRWHEKTKRSASRCSTRRGLRSRAVVHRYSPSTSGFQLRPKGSTITPMSPVPRSENTSSHAR